MASKCLTVAKLFGPNRSFTAAACHFVDRYHSFSTLAVPSNHTCSGSSRGKVIQKSSMAWMKHPYLIQGQEMLCNAKEYELEAIVRVDMPGIGREGLNLEIKNNSLHIEGKAEKEPDCDEDLLPRAYSGYIDLPPGFYNTDHIIASMKFGILKIVIPKIKPEEMKDSSLIPPPIEFRAKLVLH